MKLFSALAAAAVLVAATTTAQAAPVALVAGDKFQVVLNGSDDNINDSSDAFLGATALFTVNSVGADSVSLSVILANVGSSLDGFGSRITAFGFFTPGLVATGTSVSGVWTNALVGSGITPSAHGLTTALAPNGVNICATTNNCGAGQDGVDAGTSGLVNFTLKYGALFGGGAPTIDNFFVRYQRISYAQGFSGSGSGGGIATGIFTCVDDEKDCSTNGGGNGGTNGGTNGGDPGNGGGNGGTVPEPATMALLGFGLASAGVLRRRK